MPNSVITEALLRLEHKVDLLISLMKSNNIFLQMPQLGDQFNICPICNQQVEKFVDPIKKVLVRKCGCKTGLQAPVDLNALMPPQPAATEKRYGRDESEQEDRSDSRGDRGRRGR
jgi:hypothetical protein